LRRGDEAERAAWCIGTRGINDQYLLRCFRVYNMKGKRRNEEEKRRRSNSYRVKIKRGDIK
jgi:hypothetical protein